MIGFGNSKSTSDLLDQIWFGGEKLSGLAKLVMGKDPVWKSVEVILSSPFFDFDFNVARGTTFFK